MSLKTFSREEVKRHCSEEDVWIIIDTYVYDMSEFIDIHPGGVSPILDFAGKDATDAFYGLHRQEVLSKYDRYKIGLIEKETAQITLRQMGDISKVPYAESSAWMGFKSPYFKETHFKYRAALRKVTDGLANEAREMDVAGQKPTDEFMKKLGEHNIIAAHLGPGAWLHGLVFPGGVCGEEFDYFHEMIAHEEIARWKTRGFDDGALSGMLISLPTVANFGSKGLKEKVLKQVFSGEKRICLAITEPYAGSDVARIRTRAELTADGKHYVVNGVKKWITGGCWADYFSVAVQTKKGMSMLLVERGEGVETRLLKTTYSTSAGTAYVTFDNVKVPVENLLGQENKGFAVVLSNFNHERWAMCSILSMGCRVAIEECFQWANQRMVFGQPLIQQPVVRQKLAKMISQLESYHCWLESLTFQMNNMSYQEQSEKLAGPLALCKYLSSRVAHHISDDAVQIFGGRALTKSGLGRTIEGLQGAYKYFAILGGSEEIMADLGIRQAMKIYPQGSRL